MTLGNMYWAHNPGSNIHIMFVNSTDFEENSGYFIKHIAKFLGIEWTSRSYYRRKSYLFGRVKLDKDNNMLRFSELIPFEEGLGGYERMGDRYAPEDMKVVNCFFETEFTTGPYIILAKTAEPVKELEVLYKRASTNKNPFTFKDFSSIFDSLEVVVDAKFSNFSYVKDYLNRVVSGNFNLSFEKDSYIVKGRYGEEIPNEDGVYVLDSKCVICNIGSSLRLDLLEGLITAKDSPLLSTTIEEIIRNSWLELKNKNQQEADESEDEVTVGIKGFNDFKIYNSYLEMLTYFNEDDKFFKLLKAFPKRVSHLSPDMEVWEADEFIGKIKSELSKLRTSEELRTLDKKYLGDIPTKVLPKICSILNADVTITCYNDATGEESLTPNEAVDEEVNEGLVDYLIKAQCTLVVGDKYEIILKSSSNVVSPTEVLNLLENVANNGIVAGLNSIFNVSSILSITLEDFVRVPSDFTLGKLCGGLSSPLITLPKESEPLIYKVK